MRTPDWRNAGSSNKPDKDLKIKITCGQCGKSRSVGFSEVLRKHGDYIMIDGKIDSSRLMKASPCRSCFGSESET